jgi:hypothetical protein
LVSLNGMGRVENENVGRSDRRELLRNLRDLKREIVLSICFLFGGFDVYDASINIAVLTNHNYNVHKDRQSATTQPVSEKRETEREVSLQVCRFDVDD